MGGREMMIRWLVESPPHGYLLNDRDVAVPKYRRVRSERTPDQTELELIDSLLEGMGIVIELEE
jgi:hypothetical protein